ncbi:MAG: hypothetical protein DI536_25605 [Archangium gephyra]|uniref:Uncharacterized protein n=1 Tax=Archangium gephyra TaxID=48 RepID=A0A2W5T967_9BACT|nr:MAG: hypothetical protein DI536_25605 [Archangium gephyra]
MHSQTLAAFRAEISAVTTLQAAFNRVALSVDENALATWDGPRPEDVDDLVADDGSVALQSIRELREQAGKSLAARYKEVERVIAGRAALESLLRAALNIGTGGVVGAEGPPPSDMLSALARSGSLRLDWAQDAAHKVREVLDGHEATLPRPTAPASPIAKEGKPRAPARKSAAAEAKGPESDVAHEPRAAKRASVSRPPAKPGVAAKTAAPGGAKRAKVKTAAAAKKAAAPGKRAKKAAPAKKAAAPKKSAKKTTPATKAKPRARK